MNTDTTFSKIFTVTFFDCPSKNRIIHFGGVYVRKGGGGVEKNPFLRDGLSWTGVQDL